MYIVSHIRSMTAVTVIMCYHGYCSPILRRAHRITVLVLFSLVLFYVALFEETVSDADYNAKR